MKILLFRVRGATGAQKLSGLLDGVTISLGSATLPSGSLTCSEKAQPSRVSVHLKERNPKGLQLREQWWVSIAFC